MRCNSCKELTPAQDSIGLDELLQALFNVEKQGYAKVALGTKHYIFVSFRGCSSHDAAMWEAKGINAHGKKVDLIVCSGWPFKGVTVRTE